MAEELRQKLPYCTIEVLLLSEAYLLARAESWRGRSSPHILLGKENTFKRLVRWYLHKILSHHFVLYLKN